MRRVLAVILAALLFVAPLQASDVKQAYGSTQTLTVTNLHSLASSATVCWNGAVIDNTSDLYRDAIVGVVIDFANTTPASDKAVYVYAYGGIESGVYTQPFAGTEGTVTLTNISTTGQNQRLIGVVAYETQDAVIESQPMSVAAAFGGELPPFWGIVICNLSGAAFAASGNTVKWRGKYGTVS